MFLFVFLLGCVWGRGLSRTLSVPHVACPSVTTSIKLGGGLTTRGRGGRRGKEVGEEGGDSSGTSGMPTTGFFVSTEHPLPAGSPPSLWSFIRRTLTGWTTMRNFIEWWEDKSNIVQLVWGVRSRFSPLKKGGEGGCSLKMEQKVYIY